MFSPSRRPSGERNRNPATGGNVNPALNSRGGRAPAGIEHRRHRRYHLSIPVEVRSPKEVEPAVRTASRDVSARGIYFVVSPGVEIGAELEFDLTLPPQMCQGRMVRVHCRGRVVRRDMLEEQGKIGVAAVIDEYEFIRED